MPKKKTTTTRSRKATTKTAKKVRVVSEKQQRVEKRSGNLQGASPVREIQTVGHYEIERTKISFKPFRQEREGQITRSEFKTLALSERFELWKKLNKDEDRWFIPILRPSEVGQERMSLPEAVARGIVTEEKPKPKKKKKKDDDLTILYCPYCMDWSIFQRYSYFESQKCIGCGISVYDFYVKTDNGLWK